MNESSIYQMLVQINMTLIQIKNSLDEIKRNGLNVKTQESHAP